VAQANVKLTVDATNATRALQGVQNKTNALQKSFGGLKTAIAGIGFTVLARQAVRTSANFEKLNVRLGLLTKASGTFARSQQIAADAQKAFGLSATEALEGITDITARLQPLGVGVEDIKSTFFGFNTAAKLAGASTIEASNAFRQLAQALGSGRLQGDEFRSISEQIPTLLAPISEELGVTVGELKKFASEGKLTSEVVLRALRKIETEGSSSLKALVEADPTQVFKNLSNATEDLARAFGEKLNPVVMPAIKGLTDLTLAAVEFIDSPIAQTAAIFTGVALAVKGVTTATTLLAAAQTILIAKFKLTTAGAIAYAKATSTASIATKALAISTGALSIALNALPLVGLATLLGVATTAIIKHNKEQKKFNELVKEGSEEEVNKILKKQLEIRTKLEERLKKANGRSKQGIQNRLDEVNADIKLLEGRNKVLEKEKEITEETKRQKEEKEKVTEELKKQQEETDKLKDKMTAVGEEIESSIKNNLREAITGAQSFGQAMTNVLNKIRDKIIDAQIDKILGNFGENFGKSASGGKGKGIGGFIGGILGGLFADGGRPPVGKASIVGERGPELFVPKVAGTIIPNSKLGGGDNVTNMVTVNVDASGSSVAGNNADAQALGAVIGAAVQAQLIKEKRAGGLLSR
tara:strand:+ start:565 stop:2487 length:1923 start_codon:yes stop_codon:yes gene_type:complete